MALPHKDREIRNKVSLLEDAQYDTNKGWDQLSAKLDKTKLPVLQNPVVKRISIWKMVAAAVILLTTGFLTGRISSNQNQVIQVKKDQQLAIKQKGPKAISHPYIVAESPSNQRTPANGATSTAQSDRQAPAHKAAPISPSPLTNLKSNIGDVPVAKTINHNMHYVASNGLKYKKSPIKSSNVPHNLTLKDAKDTTDTNNEQLAMVTTKIPRNYPVIISNPVETLYPKASSSTIQKANAPLPVMGLAQINTNFSLPTIPMIQTNYTSEPIQKESIYKKLQRQRGTSSSWPIKIRF